MSEESFLKVIDTLDRYQASEIDLDTQMGRDFIVFRRELFQMYEVQNRSVRDHELYSFNIERENLRYLSRANQTFLREMERLNDIEDYRAHANLKGSIFKRKALALSRYYGLGSFGLAGLTYAYFPLVAGFAGTNTTLLGITGLSFFGMFSFRDQNVINSIRIIDEGENQGRLSINVASSIFTSREIIADVSNTSTLFSYTNEESGDNDFEANVINVNNYQDGSETVPSG